MSYNSNLFSSGMWGNSSNFFSDWASIKSGSYYKLLRANYSSTGSSLGPSRYGSTETSNVLDRILEERKHPQVSQETEEANSKLTAGIPTLTNAVATLQNEKTFTDSEGKTDAKDKTISAVKNFVTQYNDVLTNAKNSTLERQTANMAAVMRSSKENAEKLAELGITIDNRGFLKLDEAKLKSVDISKVQELFSGDDIMSYGSVVKSRLQFAAASVVETKKTEEDTEEEDDTDYTGAAGLKSDIESLTSASIFEKIKDQNGSYQYDLEKLFGAVKKFVGNYNKMFDDTRTSGNSGVMSNLAAIMQKTSENKGALEKFGISVDKNGKLTVDEDVFKKSDMAQFQSFFQNYGYAIQTNVDLVEYYMRTQADSSNGYTADGGYNLPEAFQYSSSI